MSDEQISTDTNTGEARLKKKERKQIAYILGMWLFGVVIGFSVAFFNEGTGTPFLDQAANLSLSPTLAIFIAIGFIIGFVVLPLWTLYVVDELERSNNRIAATAGCYIALAAYPVWEVLHAGNLAPDVNAFGIWVVTIVATTIAYCYARFRP